MVGSILKSCIIYSSVEKVDSGHSCRVCSAQIKRPLGDCELGIEQNVGDIGPACVFEMIGSLNMGKKIFLQHDNCRQCLIETSLMKH